MNKNSIETNGHAGVGVSGAAPLNVESPNPDDGEFSKLEYVDHVEVPAPNEIRPKTFVPRRGRKLRGLFILGMLAILVAGFFFFISGGGKKKIDLPIRDRAAQAEPPTGKVIEDETAQAIAELRSGASASPSPTPVTVPSAGAAAALSGAPITVPLSATVLGPENATPTNASGAPAEAPPARSAETAPKRNTERSIRCAPLQKPVAASSKRPSAPDLARGLNVAPPGSPATLEKSVTLPPFGAMLPVKTLGAIYTLRPSLSRFALTRDVRGDGWLMRQGTILVGQQAGSELDRAFVSLTGFIDPASGKFVRLSGDALGSDGAPGLQGKRRRISGRWAQVLSRAAGAAVSLGQAALSRGGTVVNISGAVSPELQTLSPSVSDRREFVEVPAGKPAFLLVTDLPKEIRGADPRPVADNANSSSLGDDELANLLTDGSPEQIRAALPRMTPQLRQLAEAVLRESGNSDVIEGSKERKR